MVQGYMNERNTKLPGGRMERREVQKSSEIVLKKVLGRGGGGHGVQDMWRGNM